jgi:hypothetical protein
VRTGERVLAPSGRAERHVGGHADLQQPVGVGTRTLMA